MGYDNSIAISGNLTKDAEIKDLGQSKICNLRIAWNSKDKEGNSVGHFFDCVAWNELAENMADWKKGERVIIHGRLNYSEWESDDGKRSATRLQIEDAGLSVKWKTTDSPTNSTTRAGNFKKPSRPAPDEDPF
tara:strand:- start:2084 stop:2482 length:399 start_codon:yes stop_codon:yes gene_type:complete